MSTGATAGLTVAEARRLALAAWDVFAERTDALDAAALAATPTRLAGWTVQDLTRHTAWGMSMEAEALRLAVVAEPLRHGARAAGRPTDALTGEALHLAWHRSRAELAAGFDTVAAAVGRGLAPVLPMPYGDVPLTVALDTFVMEAAVHTDDLLAALAGRGAAAPPLDPAVVAPTARFLQHFWSVLGSAGTPVPAGTTVRLVGDTVAVGGTFDGTAWRALDADDGGGPSDGGADGSADGGGGASVTLRGDDSTVLRVALGRVPVASAGLQLTGDAGLARALKEHVPGP
nr:maleylpyruvate isomerase N-terminal domain-containing protein [uncultured Actinotalea sp.]